jgi:rubrerythrin
MYPNFRDDAVHEGNTAAVIEATSQIEESREHAAEFAKVLAKAERRFAALKGVEQRHATAYQKMLEEVQ